MVTQSISDNFQGGIIKGHGRKHCGYLAIEFENIDIEIDEIKQWISVFSELITTVGKQNTQRENKDELPLETHYNIAFGREMFQSTNHDESKIGKSPFPSDLVGDHELTVVLQYNPGERQNLYISSGIHIVIIVANEKLKKVNDAITEIKHNLQDRTISFNSSEIIANKMSNSISGSKDSFGPLGFLDGISNPNDDDTEDLVLHDGDDFGPSSFMVIANFKRNGTHFEEQVDDIVTNMYHNFEDRSDDLKEKLKEHCSAMLMGRYKNGNTLYRDTPNFSPEDFAGDPTGSTCPLAAHVRISREVSKGNNRIVRRGMPYHLTSTNDKGLIFVSYQKDILKQIVPLINAMKARRDFVTYSKTDDFNTTPVLFHPMPNISESQPYEKEIKDFKTTILLGATYMFLPSVSYLRGLSPVL